MSRRRSFARSVLTLGAAVSLLALPGVAVHGQGGAPFAPHPSTQLPARLVTIDMLKRWEQELSNWGRWGKDDQRGMLNEITPARTKAALALVREARTVTLQINPIKKTGSDTGTFGENLHRMARVHPVTGAIQGALDVIHLSLHDGLQSHMDALCHYQGPIGRKPGEPAVSYNGFPFTLTAAGCIESAADRMGPGYLTRGVLVDLPLMKGVKWLEPSTPILRRGSRGVGEVRRRAPGPRRRDDRAHGTLGQARRRRPVELRPAGRGPACVGAAVAEGAADLTARE